MQTLMYKYFIVFRHTYIYRVYTCKCKKIKITKTMQTTADDKREHI